MILETYLAPEQSHQRFWRRIVELHLELVEERQSAAQRHHGADCRDIEAGLGGGKDGEGEQGQPDRQAAANGQTAADDGLEMAKEQVGELGVEDVEEHGQPDDGCANVARLHLGGGGGWRRKLWLASSSSIN